MGNTEDLSSFVPECCKDLLEMSDTELRSEIPDLARDWERMMKIENAVEDIPSEHRFHRGDARDLYESQDDGSSLVDDESVQLIITSPPYFNIKSYNEDENQLGEIDEYKKFSEEIYKVWRGCYNKLVPGGRMCIVTGDILQSRRENGRHRALPLHSTIQNQCYDIGFDCLAPIIWYKIGNASLEAGGNSRFLGKPYEPGAVIKNDIEYILLFRKPGGYRSPSISKRILSTIQVDYHKRCFQQIWTDIQGERSDSHPAPYPLELAERLIRMQSFVDDTVMDPFAGIGTTASAAFKTGRNSVNIEIDPEFISIAKDRLEEKSNNRKEIVRLSDFGEKAE